MKVFFWEEGCIVVFFQNRIITPERYDLLTCIIKQYENNKMMIPILARNRLDQPVLSLS